MKIGKKIRKYRLLFCKKAKKLYYRGVSYIKIKYCNIKHKFLMHFLKTIPIEAKFLNGYYSIIFKIKSYYLAYTSLITITSFLYQVIYLLIVFFVSFIIFRYSEKYDDYQSILYTLLGAVLSMYVTLLFAIGSNLLKAIKYLTLTQQDIVSMLNCVDAVFKNFMFYPLRDEFCVRGDNIIYITPMKAGGGYDEDELINYTNIISNLSYSDFCNYLDEQKTRFLMKQLKLQSFTFNNTYSTILHRQDLINKNCFLLFSQFYQSLMSFLYQDNFEWRDEQIKNGLYLTFKILVYKMNMSIIILQKELPKYEKYINYIAKQPEINRQNLANYMNKKMERFRKRYINLLASISNSPKNEWDIMFKEILKSMNKV